MAGFTFRRSHMGRCSQKCDTRPHCFSSHWPIEFYSYLHVWFKMAIDSAGSLLFVVLMHSLRSSFCFRSLASWRGARLFQFKYQPDYSAASLIRHSFSFSSCCAPFSLVLLPAAIGYSAVVVGASPPHPLSYRFHGDIRCICKT